MCAPLVKVNHFWFVPVKMLGEIRAVPAGLLVLPLAGHEHRHLDLVDKGDRVEGSATLRHVVGVGPDLRRQVGGLAVKDLVGLAGLIALLDLLLGIGLRALGAPAT